ncbi:putative DNA-binding protein (MmcQ/YjbR family) [Leucobacter exalbidus]|uniref:DNA-binding protein (MmcQ/YjbR family) n=1 Tax=Leucobacter exalbidus TaxID=662960 RepID=A0A940PUJ5_9MICO|nr:MmcQ/YjbR family DNA-binding protein [Leucobacter exalbidus]MBP1325554.1 putative DNA-binding protein (MmcQ/YjbR family) [Leucobacter exalbidus]
MNGSELQQHAFQRAEQLPGATLEHPFGPDHDVYKIVGKVFLLASTVRDEPVVTLKARPADSQVLQQAFPQITPGYHMNKRHWITVRAGTTLDLELFLDLVTESYLLVLETLPRAVRPVNPETFGRSTRP